MLGSSRLQENTHVFPLPVRLERPKVNSQSCIFQLRSLCRVPNWELGCQVAWEPQLPNIWGNGLGLRVQGKWLGP